MIPMTSIQSIYEQYRILPQKAKEDFIELLQQEKVNKEQKLKKRISDMNEMSSFFESIRKGLPDDYSFNREVANER